MMPATPYRSSPACPLSISRTVPVENDYPRDAGPSKMMITVIDDSATTVVILKSLSSKVAGGQATGFTDAVAALEHLQASPTDLVIIDYSMPNMTGIELIKRLRETELHRHTPIIMVTTSSELAVRARALDVGATAFLQKPLKAVEFLECVTQIADDKALRGIPRDPSRLQQAV